MKIIDMSSGTAELKLTSTEDLEHQSSGKKLMIADKGDKEQDRIFNGRRSVTGYQYECC